MNAQASIDVTRKEEELPRRSVGLQRSLAGTRPQ